MAQLPLAWSMETLRRPLIGLPHCLAKARAHSSSALGGKGGAVPPFLLGCRALAGSIALLP